MSAPETGTERTVGQLFASATADLTTLVHDEFALAKAEISASVKKGGAGAVSVGAAVVILLASIPMFSFALVYGIRALGVPLGWSFMIVGGIYVVLAIIAALVARSYFKKLTPPERTIASTRATVDMLSNAKPHPAVELPEDAKKALTR